MTDNSERSQCCERDHNRDGNCDIHSAPGVLRTEAFRTSKLRVACATTSHDVEEGECPWCTIERLKRENETFCYEVKRWSDIASSNAKEAERLTVEQNQLLAAVGEHVTVRSDQYALIQRLMRELADLHAFADDRESAAKRLEAERDRLRFALEYAKNWLQSFSRRTRCRCEATTGYKRACEACQALKAYEDIITFARSDLPAGSAPETTAPPSRELLESLAYEHRDTNKFQMARNRLVAWLRSSEKADGTP